MEEILDLRSRHTSAPAAVTTATTHVQRTTRSEYTEQSSVDNEVQPDARVINLVLDTSTQMSQPVPGMDVSWRMHFPYVGKIREGSTLFLQDVAVPMRLNSNAEVYVKGTCTTTCCGDSNLFVQRVFPPVDSSVLRNGITLQSRDFAMGPHILSLVENIPRFTIKTASNAQVVYKNTSTGIYGVGATYTTPVTFKLLDDAAKVFANNAPGVKHYAILDDTAQGVRHSSGTLRANSLLLNNDWSWVLMRDMSDPANPAWKIANDYPSAFTAAGFPSNGVFVGVHPTTFALFNYNFSTVQNPPSFIFEPDLPPRYHQHYWLHVRSGLVAHYNGDGWDAVAPSWRDISGSNNHVLAANITGGSNITVAIDEKSGHRYLQGLTTSSIVFPTTLTANSYTLLYVARYRDAFNNRRRILQGTTGNWLSGFHQGRVGLAYHGQWIAPQTNLHGLREFVVHTDQTNLYRSNRVQRNTVGGTFTPSQICINSNVAYNMEYSDWEVACILLYNRELTASEIVEVESYLYNHYQLNQDKDYKLTVQIDERPDT